MILLLIFLETGLKSKLDSLNSELRKIREERKILEKEEIRTLYSLESLNKEINILNEIEKSLINERLLLEYQVFKLENLIRENELELEKTKKFIKNFLVSLYKYGRINPLNIIKGQGSFLSYYTGILAVKRGIEFKEEVLKKGSLLLKDLREKKEVYDKKVKHLLEIEEITSEKKLELESSKKEKEKILSQIRKKRKDQEKLELELVEQVKKFEKLLEKIEKERVAQLKRELPESIPRKKFGWPIKGEIVSYFGTLWHPEYKTKVKNNGIDIKAKPGEKVVSADAGIVVYSDYFMGYGLTVIVDHGDGFFTVYSGLSRVYVSPGKAVSKGEPIGEVGLSIFSSHYTLHFEIRYGGKALDPILFLPFEG
ncbi:MAG: peptidoglycan DD-metalloendopeptidase family protein [Candidatus Hydrothermales bacterium]